MSYTAIDAGLVRQKNSFGKCYLDLINLTTILALQFLFHFSTSQVQVPNSGWHKFDALQNASVLPQFPFTEQQFPGVLPRQMAPTDEAAPHFPSVEGALQVP